jgi:putative membrane protein
MNDPRVFFAAERTLLAWLRTGIAVIGVGFLVSRFGLFLRMLRDGHASGAHSASTYLGVGFVLLGAAGIAGAAFQYLIFLRTLSPSERPASYWTKMGFWYSSLIALLGVGLAAYLIWGLST